MWDSFSQRIHLLCFYIDVTHCLPAGREGRSARLTPSFSVCAVHAFTLQVAAGCWGRDEQNKTLTGIDIKICARFYAGSRVVSPPVENESELKMRIRLFQILKFSCSTRNSSSTIVFPQSAVLAMY